MQNQQLRCIGSIRYAAALLSSVFMLLAFYFPAASWLIFIALIPVILASIDIKWPQMAGLWFVTTAVYGLGVYATLPDIFIEKATDKDWVAYLGSLFILVWQLVPFILFAVLAGLFRYQNQSFACLRLTTLLLVLIHFIPSPFTLSFATHIELPLVVMQLADLGGIALLDFVVIYINFKIAFCLFEYCDKKALPRIQILSVSAVITGLFLYGFFRIQTVSTELVKTTNISRVTLVPTEFKMPVTRNQQVEYLLAQTLINSQSDLIIWPELPNPLRQKGGVAFTRAIEKISQQTQASVLTHNLTFSSEFNDYTQRPYRYNLVSLFQNQQVVAEHKKQILLPFVEYLPFESWLRDYFPKPHIYKSGKKPSVITVNKNLRIAPLICYEADFAEYAQSAVTAGANLLISVANDTWTHARHLARKHFYQAQLRAIENRVSLVRVTNLGYSGVIEPTGRIQWQVWGDAPASTQTIKKIESGSFYRQYPNAFWLLIVLAAWVISKQSWILKRIKKPDTAV